MDLFNLLVLFIILCILFSLCGWCCKGQKEGVVYGLGGNPTVTVTTQGAPTAVPPYPLNASHPMPHIMPPAPGPGFAPGGYQTGPYPVHTAPYPPAPAPGFYPIVNMPGVAPMGGYAPHPSSTAPYPPSTLPPSYSEAVGQPPVQPNVTNEVYHKQAPYNPNY